MTPAAGPTPWAAAGVFIAVGVAGLAAAGALGGLGITCWMHRLLSYSHQRPLPPGVAADAIVVLGYALHRNGTCTAPLQSRVRVAVALWQEGAAPRIIFSGAHPGGGVRNVTEADAMWEYALTLVDRPPLPDTWLREGASTSTRTNALFSWQLAAPQRWRRLVLATNPFHQRRSFFTFVRAARDLRLDATEVFVAYAPCAPHRGYLHWWLDSAADQWDFWRELAATAYYAARGWL